MVTHDSHTPAKATPQTPERTARWRNRLARAWSAAVDYQHVWGSVEVGRPQQGFRRYRLIVLPPGVTAAERRRVRLARGWPTWGAVLFVVSLVCVGAALGPWSGLVTSSVLWLCGSAVVLSRAGDVGARVRTVSVILIVRHDDPASTERFTLLKAVLGQLTCADVQLERGTITPAHHEFLWGLAYDRLGSDPRQLG